VSERPRARGPKARLAALRTVCALGLVLAVAVALAGGAAPGPSRDWPVYGGSSAGTRYSTLDQINRANVGQLQVAWTFDTGETGGFQVNPIVVDGVLYANTPSHKAIALDAATGVLRWRFDPGIEGRGPNRGVTYWASGEDRRIFAAVDHYLYALDARAGRPIASFGEQGRLDLRKDLGRDPSAQSVQLTSPGIVYRDLIVVGGRVSEGDGASPGDVRAYDARTGRLRWAFHTIPRPGEPGSETWPPGAWRVIGGANNWAGMALDEARGLLFVPTGSAAPDFYGGNRIGDNLYANTLLALKAGTGERVWHFQAVRHDIWDRDFPSPPTLVTVRREGRDVDAVAQITKHGVVFLFDRESGTPLFPIEYRRFPASDVPGEVTADTQPMPVRPAPFARQLLTKDLLTSRTPAARAWALEAFAAMRSDGQFVPFSLGRDTVVFPGFDGGAEWGGAAFDPASGLLFVNANDVPWTGALAPNVTSADARSVYLKECALCHGDDRKGAPPQLPSLDGVSVTRTPQQIAQVIRQGAGRMPGFPNLSPDDVAALVEYLRAADAPAAPAAPPAAGAAPRPAAPVSAGAHGNDADRPPRSRYRFTGYKRFLDPDGYPAVAPPWGTLTAIDLHTGDHAWQVPLGEYPELAAAGMKDTGTENYGGPIVTAGGLVFIGATNFDRKFRAFDKATGKLLWEATLPFAGNATPATYEVNGRQFVVIPAGGGKARGAPSGGVYVAFALPR
jgi:quinoprotein glucose dehydrogenase